MRLGRTAAIAGAAGVVASLLALPALPAAAQAQVEVFASDFEDGTTQGWFGRGSAQVATSDAQASSGTQSLLSTGRADTWQGPGRDLRGVLQPGTTYQIEAFVRLADPGATEVHLTVQRTPSGGETAFERVVSNVAVTDTGWVRVAGAYSFASATNDELQLYVESADPTASFYLDAVTITTTELPPDVLAAADFEDGTTQGWGARGPATVAATQDDAVSGEWSLLTTGRTDAWHGPSFNLTSFVAVGQAYGISFALKLAPGAEPAPMFLSLQTGEGESAGFARLAANTVTADEWVRFSATWTPTAEAEAFHVYAESGSVDDLADFYLDDFQLTGITPPEIEDIPPLREVLAPHFPVGVAIEAIDTVGAPAELLTRHFGTVTAGNDMKPERIQPVEGTFTFEAADALVAFADANGDLPVYGHTLLWHNQTPDWFFQDADGAPLSGGDPEHRQLLIDRMEAHIAAIAAHYGDRMWAWDVVNEAIDESQEDGLRRSPWYEIIGPEYVDLAFQFAREHFGPDVRLFLNDFNTEFPAKREAMFNVVSGMLERGVPIDGVGHQLHVSLVRPVSLVDETLERFSELPVQQAITELDVSISRTSTESLPAPPPDRLVRQGYYYRDLFEVLRAHDDLLSQVTIWGLHDGRSWLRTFPVVRPHEAPLFFDDQLQSKPAYWGVVDPEALPHLPQEQDTPAGSATVDGERELLWDLLPAAPLPGGEAGFQARWDQSTLSVLIEVTDDTVDAEDRVELYVDDTNAKAGEYGPGVAHYRVGRDGTVAGGATTAVTETATGYRVEAALPLPTPGAQGREVGFDVRVTDGGSGAPLSWSDQEHQQDTDTSRWGTLSLIEAVRQVDIPRATTAPAIDATVEAGWESAGTVRTEVLTEGDADGAQADVRLLWDADRLYLLAEIADPQLDAGSSDPWQQDSIEIFVDPRNSKSGAYQADDGQYRINFENHQTINGVIEVVGDDLTSATAVVDGGYLVEASVELDTIEPAVGSLIGLDLQVNDATDGARTSAHTWHDPTGQSFQDTSRWGVARLVAPAEEPAPACDQTIEGIHVGAVDVSAGVLCLAAGAKVVGPVSVGAGASLVAADATVLGVVTAVDAERVVITGSRLVGRVSLTGATGELTLAGNVIVGPVTVTGNHTGDAPILVAGNTLIGTLSCTGNEPPPVDGGEGNTVIGRKSGQCRTL